MVSNRLLATAVFLAFLHSAISFGHVPGPCSDVCSGNTLEEAVVCLDKDYTDSADGKSFHDCVACELGSTAVDTATNQTDVEWGLCTSMQKWS